MIHLADQGDPGTEDDRANASAEIGQDRPAGTGEPGTEAVVDDKAGKQNGQTQQACDFHPVRCDESEEGGRDQTAQGDRVTEESQESFPASDPPSWTPEKV